MASKGSAIRQILRAKPLSKSRLCQHGQRCGFAACTLLQTDGVFRALTGERVQKPWIEAFREQQSGQRAQEQARHPSTPKERDLSPKKMSDSYHSVVGSERVSHTLQRIC